MAATKKAAATATRTREAVELPQSVSSEEAVWPGSNRGAGSKNAALREQLTAEVSEMEHGSVRRYDIAGNREQEAFATLFRKVVDTVFGPIYGVQVSKQTDCLFVKIGDRKAANS